MDFALCSLSDLMVLVVMGFLSLSLSLSFPPLLSLPLLPSLSPRSTPLCNIHLRGSSGVMDQALGSVSEAGGLNFALLYPSSENCGRLFNFSEPQFTCKIILMVAEVEVK